MHHVALTQFAQAAAGKDSDVFAALGINWQMLLFQIIGFSILVFLMGKYVYPILMKQVDKRQDAIEESLKAAQEAQKQASNTQAAVDKQLREARQQAKDIVATAKEEATAMVQDAETKGKAQAEHIVANAHEELAKEVIAAKKALHNETIELVALATEKVVGNVVDAKVDGKVIKSALEGGK